jgi:hypothetical protein
MCVGAAYGRGMVPSAALPNPAEPGFIGLGAVLGAMAGRAAAWALGYDVDNSVRWSVDGSYYGTVVALTLYLVVNIVEVGLP